MRAWGVGAVAALLCLSAPAAVIGHSHLSDDPRVERARTLIDRGAFFEALDILRMLPDDLSDRTDIRFLVGLAAARTAERSREDSRAADLFDEAIAAFRAILVDDADLVRVRFELARVFFLKREDSLARGHFERVLAARLEPGVAEHIRGYLHAIRARRRWEAWLRLHVAPDTNIAAASDEKFIHIDGLPPLRRGGSSLPRSGVGLIVRGGGEYFLPLHAGAQWRLGAEAAQREYAAGTFDRTFAAVRTGPRFLLDGASEFSLLGVVRQWWDNAGLASRDTGIRIEGERRLSGRLMLNGQASWHTRRDSRSGGDFDGPMLDTTLGTAWLVSPTVRIDSFVGWSRQRPRAYVWRNRAIRAGVGVSVAADRGFTFGAGADWQRTAYQGSWYPFTRARQSRRDRLFSLRASVFNRGFEIFGFSPQLVIVHDIGLSNAQLHSYRRTHAEIQLVRQF